MTDEYDMKMLTALGRLVGQHGAHPLMGLAQLIRDPERAEELASALERAAARPSRGNGRPKSQRTDRVGMAVLRELRSDPEKHAVVSEIRHQLISRTILPSMDDIRRFAMMNDLSIGKASSRTAAIAPLLRSLSQLSTPEILRLRDSIIQAAADDRSLDRWRDVIVRPRPTK